jgi:hypothetical protein
MLIKTLAACGVRLRGARMQPAPFYAFCVIIGLPGAGVTPSSSRASRGKFPG